ncbi:exocyst complex component SEC5A-like isoform X2 [Telopea speciosissima]|uniref:exocyst complex component SEC5A-like isoform X2 n=1 Tax=Telopea speciosissima TaxID=54955 RepID=UPI001CC4053A|nr:exocyst complex component SEC5A-like isoform X2 [Telopea speciosissima]
MSSEIDDIDEDELLQIALQEQAERELNYRKPQVSKASKPVVNLIQRPPPPPQLAKDQTRGAPPKNTSSNPAQVQKSRRAVDDDDDSDVEMLSISSGDEDDSKDLGNAAKIRAAGGGGKRRDDASDRGWDGDEPYRWKQVDEAELVRRVREMRETRTVPVPQNLDRKGSALGQKGLNNVHSFPRGMECVDPLGLGVIDNKSLRLVTETSESSPAKLDKDSLDTSTREKLMYFSEKFDAKLFLSRVHQDTSGADLEAGALTVKSDLIGRTQQRKQLVKENFDCFVSCKTTIDDIESKLKRIEEDPEGAGTAHLFNCIQSVSSLAHRAFEPLFERQVQTEKIRSVQGMLQRFRTLFNLPSSIRGSINKGEYDLAVREYRKAKSIVLPSHVGILKRVLEEVEKLMHEFKGMLYKSMEDPQIDLADLENTVRLLLELEPESDPVWHYLNIQNNRIRGLLERCTLDHEARMETLHNEIHERALSDARWRQIQQDSNKSSDVDSSLLGDAPVPVDSEVVDLNSEEVDGLRGRYIRRLTMVLIYHIPAFWKVALSVFSGKFAKSSHSSAELNVKASVNKPDDKCDVKYSSHSLDEVAGMLHNTMSAYEVKVQSTFRDLEESNILRPYMTDAIKEISNACQAIEGKESAPPSVVTSLRTLHAEIIKIYILRLCSWMRATTEEIAKDESWIPVSILERNKSPYTISFLPLSFRTMMSSAMDQIGLMIQSLRSEAMKSDNMFLQLQEIQESVRLAFLNCFVDFAAHLECIGGEISLNKLNQETSHVENGYFQPQAKARSLHPGNVVCDPHQKLLIVLSNIGYCKDELSHELYNKYTYIWLQPRDKNEGDSDIQDLVMSFSALEEKVLAQYTFAKANLIRTAAIDYLLDAGVQWGGAPAVKGVRDAAVDLLHTLVAVHAEVFSGAKPLLDKTLGILVEGLIDTFLSLLHENKSKDLKSLDANGFCQLMLELEYFETILNPYFTPEASESLKSLQGVLLEKASESVTESSENPGHHRRPTRGSEDAILDERQQGMTVSPDDLIALAQQYSSELLQAELERTRINTACFAESIPLDSVPEPAKAAYASFRGSMDSPRSFSAESVESPSYSLHKRR